ncbi:MAG: response regulator [Acidimicrobiia bacterium]
MLVVDDDESIRSLFAIGLTRAGFDVRVAANGPDALSVMADEPISVVLLDAHMPGMSGLDVLAALRDQPGCESLPVVLVTGADDRDDRARGLEAGANDYLVKPVRLDEIATCVRSVLHSPIGGDTDH